MFRDRRIAKFSLLTALAWLSVACSSSEAPAADASDAGQPATGVGCTQAEADTYVPGMKKPGDAGRYGFELVSSAPAPPAIDDNIFVVQVSDLDGKPAAGELSVALDMPEHGHQSLKQPKISFDAAAGAFTLDPMELFMVGLWRFTFTFAPEDSATSESVSGDSAVFKFCID